MSAEATSPVRDEVLRLVAAGLSLLLVAALAAGCGSREAPPNLLLITIDTLRPDHLGAGGHARAPSPSIDRFLRESTSFRTAVVPRGQTWPTLTTIQTSLYPVTHGVRKNGQKPHDGTRHLAQVLEEEGWSCAAFLSNCGQTEWPGFEVVRDLRDQDRALVSQAKGWMRGTPGPFFVWLHLFAPHRPYAPPRPLDRMYDPTYSGEMDGSIDLLRRIAVERRELSPADVEHALALYDGEVRWVDSLLDELFEFLDETDLTANTIVAFTADHGEELYERHQYFSHSASVYDAVLRVPLAFRWPGRIAPDRRLAGVVELMDLAPTLLELVDIEIPQEFAGHGLGAVLLGQGVVDPERLAFSELEDQVVSLRSKTHRYVHNPTGFDFPLEYDGRRTVYPIERRELYDLRVDPQERRNRAVADPATADALREAAVRWQAEHRWDDAGRRHQDSPVPEALREQLEAIGYAR